MCNRETMYVYKKLAIAVARRPSAFKHSLLSKGNLQLPRRVSQDVIAICG